MENFGNTVISIIVPLYKGKKYVGLLLDQIEKCADHTDAKVEIVFVNDYPEEDICDIISNKCKIVILKNKVNLGIHASRINGLYASKGEYVLFLDQDDFIRPDYIRSQLEHIGNADAVVCRLLNGDKEHYTKSFEFSDVISKEFMMTKWCSIVSPGQVLIRRKAIPQIWTQNPVKENGADDYFLWLAMFGLERQFALNNEILFEHRITGFNTSLDTNKMMDSEHEMLDILKTSEEFHSFINLFSDLEVSLRRIHIKQLDNLSMAYSVLSTLCSVKASRLRECFGAKIAIYGAADIGRAFYQGLSENGDTQIFFIDRNAEYISTNVPVYKLEDAPNDADTVIIAVNGVINGIKNELSKRYSCKIFSISEALQSVLL